MFPSSHRASCNRFLSSAAALLGLLAGAQAGLAATTEVSSIPALQSAINAANPGDLIIVRNGVYTTTAALTVTRVGTATAPIVISAESIGGVEITGSNGFTVSSPAAHIEIEGFKFRHASGKTSIGSGTKFIRFTRNVFQCTGDGPYLSVSGGTDAEVDRNEFHDKQTVGNMISVSGPSGQVAQRLWIHHNYFHDFRPGGGNGSETIRLGLSGVSMSMGRSLVEHNLFVRCNGENELISNKSGGNTYRYNTLIDSPGAQLTLRHGNECVVYGNYFRNTDGLRVYGDRHQIHSNYFEGNTKGIDMGNGDGEVADGAALTCHDRPDDCIVVFNTLINNTTQYQMGGRTNGLGATNIAFANNVIQGGGTAVNISGTAPYANPTWSGNIVWNATNVGNIPAAGYTNVNPLLAADANGIFHLQAGSPAIDNGSGSYDFVDRDQDGQPRSGAKDKGADEFSSAPSVARILTSADVGPLSGLSIPAAAPTFNPGAGTFTGAQTVVIATPSSGASIRFTTDGSTPSETAGTVYTGPVSIGANTIVRAMAYGPGFDPSSVASATYNIRASAPTFSPAGGTFAAPVTVTLASSTSGATLRYTTDGSLPSSNNGPIYAGPFVVSATSTVRAMALKAGMTDSTITSSTYTIDDGSVTVTPADGFRNTPLPAAQNGSFVATFDASPSISPSNALIGLSQGAQAAYTGIAAAVRFSNTGVIDARNGSVFAAASSIPFAAGAKYRFRLVVNVATRTYSAFVTPPSGAEIAIGTNYAFRTEQAAVTSLDTSVANVNASPGGALTVGPVTVSALPKVAAPTFSPGGGTYSSVQSVTLTCATPGAGIRYTTNGTTPTATSGTVYSSPVSIGATTTLKAIAFKADMVDSNVSTASYTINLPVPAKLAVGGAAVTASGHDGNLPANSVDGNLATRWSASGDGQWIQYDLGATKTLTEIKIAWYNGNLRASSFEVQVSSSPTGPFATIHSATSSGTSASLESYNVPDTATRYVRILGHGNSVNAWNSISETELWGF